MLVLSRKYLSVILLVALFLYVLHIVHDLRWKNRADLPAVHRQAFNSSWARRPQQYPVPSFQQLPYGQPLAIPRIQHHFNSEPKEARRTREARLQAVKQSFTHAWEGYKHHAWLKDEVAPLSGEPRDSFGGWAATLVDSLDTLWIMGLHDQWNEAIVAVTGINFESSNARVISVFETTIRYLGGLLSAYDLSGNDVLLRKATELGEMLYAAFDTPNRMPVPYWDWKK